MKYNEKTAIESLERKGCKFNYSAKMIEVPFDKSAGGCKALGNGSWGKVRTLCNKYHWEWRYSKYRRNE